MSVSRNLVYKVVRFSSKILRRIDGLKFMFSKKATKIDEIFTVDLTVTTYCQIDGEDFVNFCGLLRKYELYRSLKKLIDVVKILPFYTILAF